MTDDDKQVSAPEVPCIDCGRPYPHGLDLVLTKKQWLMVHPDDHGVLCPSCIVNRAAELPRAISIYAHIEFGEHFDLSDDALEKIVLAIRLENADYCANAGDLKHRIVELTAEVARLSAPVSDDEWDKNAWHGRTAEDEYMQRRDVDDLIAKLKRRAYEAEQRAAKLEQKLNEFCRQRLLGKNTRTAAWHTPPDVESCRENRRNEPQGERLRDELEAWLEKNEIVSILMDAESHFIDIQWAAPLPGHIKPVLTLWGSIYVKTNNRKECK
jgi:hypothetical protein